MGATSVTGVSGPGAAQHKGPHNGRDYFLPSNGPRIIYAGNVRLDGDSYTLRFPEPLPGGMLNYAFICTALGNDRISLSVGGAENEDGDLAQITILGDLSADNNIVSFVVMAANLKILTEE